MTYWRSSSAVARVIETFRSDNDYDYDYDYGIRTWEAGTRLYLVAVVSASNETLDCQFVTTVNETVFHGEMLRKRSI